MAWRWYQRPRWIWRRVARTPFLVLLLLEQYGPLSPRSLARSLRRQRVSFWSMGFWVEGLEARGHIECVRISIPKIADLAGKQDLTQAEADLQPTLARALVQLQAVTDEVKRYPTVHLYAITEKGWHMLDTWRTAHDFKFELQPYPPPG